MKTRFYRINRLTLITLAIGVIFLSGNCRRMQTITADIYIAADGKDTNPGTENAPIATFTMARNMVRQKVQEGLKRDIQILIREGVYLQTEPLSFGPEDSGSTDYSITYAAYPGEKVILSGGQRISGWKKEATGIWTTQIPDVKDGKRYFRQLFVNGQRTIRARTPNIDDQMPWWKIRTSTVSLKGILPGTTEVQPPEDLPITVSVTGQIRDFNNPRDVELVYIQNNAGSRKYLGTINIADQTFTLDPPHKWNPMAFGTEWKLSIPIEGTACYLENALEMLDQPGEWYLDRQTGLLSYWPRADEDLNKVEVIAPVIQYTLLSVSGTREKPVSNLHFKGIHVECVEWPLPASGYAGMFCCNVAVGEDPRPGHKLIEGAVEYSYAHSCNFTDGGIAHVGGMGFCLRNGTENIVIEGNEIWDVGGGGIGAGYPNVAYGYLYAAPPPELNEYKGYRIANNYIHHCGMIDFGAVGILMMSPQECIVSHNLIHDIAYIGLGFAGSQDPQVPFAKNNIIEYNHIYNAMKVTVDGAGMYITFAQYDRGCLIRGNLVHDIIPNRSSLRPVGPYSAAGIYLDGHSSGNQYENNLTFGTSGALFINGKGRDLLWLDNIFLKNGTPPHEFVEAMQDLAGLEPAYRLALQKKESTVCSYYPLAVRDTANNVWAAYQYDRPQSGTGVIVIFRRSENGDETTRFKLHALDPKTLYEFKTWIGKYDQNDQNLISEIQLLPETGKLLEEDKIIMTGQQLMEDGVQVKMADRPSVSWIVYQRTSDAK